MDFDAASFLKSLFGGAAPAAVPDVTAGDCAGAIDASDGEADGAAAVPDADGILLQWIEPDGDIALPPCPTCGGSDLWETILGVWKCQHCDAAALERSRSLAAKAARLRHRQIDGIRDSL